MYSSIIKSVQRGSSAAVNGSVDVAISPVDRDKSILLFNSVGGSAIIRGVINSNSITLVSTAAGTVTWEVITFR